MRRTSGWGKGDGIPDGSWIALRELLHALAAVPVFALVGLCPGYAAGWLTDVCAFRRRSVVERLFWSVPLSFAVMGIGGELLGRFAGQTAVVALVVLCATACAVLIVRDVRRGGVPSGFRPLGWAAVWMTAGWVALVMLSMTDWGSGQKLRWNMALLDQSFRVSWIDAVLRTGVPPANPQYWFHGPAPMQNYYFWYVLCATVARLGHVPARAAMTAGCVWSGFLLAAVTGLYLKHMLAVGRGLRRQFLVAIGLLTVTGLDLLVTVAMIFGAGTVPAPDMEAWSKDGVISWLHTLLWAPHHMAGMVLCMTAFLLAWTAREARGRELAVRVAWIALTLASAFGISVYTTLAFFAVAVLWAVWRLCAGERRPVFALGAGGAGAIVLLLPYVWQLTHAATGSHAGGGSRFPLVWTVREMIPPEGLLGTALFREFAAGHPLAALNAAKLVLLTPGYVLELGAYLGVLMVFLVPRWRGREPLTEAQRTLVFLALAALPAMTFLRSSVLAVNDFGWRSALLMQFPLLLLASEALSRWRRGDAGEIEGAWRGTPRWLRAVVGLALVLGACETGLQALSLRFTVPMAEAVTNKPEGWPVKLISHQAYVAEVGYEALDRAIPKSAIVQFNPWHPNVYWTASEMLSTRRQVAIGSDQPWCGAELGGEPSGCVPMAKALDAVFVSAAANEARTVCHEFGIDYLVATAYDPAWKRGDGWVWMLPAVVAQPEFRAVACR